MEQVLENILSDISKLNFAELNYELNDKLNYIYEMNFKRYFLVYFTTESEQILRVYSDNLLCAILSYYDVHKRLDLNFINTFIKKQFQCIDFEQLKFEK